MPATCPFAPPPRLPSRGAAVLVAGLHLALGIALLQMPTVQKPLRQVVLDAAPLMVSLWMPPAPAPTPAAATPPPTVRALRPPAALSPSVLAAPPAPPEVGPTPVPSSEAAAPQRLAPEGPPAMPAAAAALTGAAAAVGLRAVPPPAAPAPPPPPAPVRKQVTAAAMGYLVPPPAEVPLASRRAGESGVVWLRVVVDVQGLPAEVRVQRSSGHPRLDAQAVAAMRQARFRPHTEGGLALEVEVLAPIEYPSE